MKRLLGPRHPLATALAALTTLAVLTALTGCGGESGDRADDPATQEQTDAAAPRVVDIVSGSAAGGDVAAEATVIEDDRALERYLRQFDSDPFVGELTEAIDAHELAGDRVLGLAVIEISCDEPPSATVTSDGDAFVVTAAKVTSPHIECYAPVTSVAVLDLPRP